MITIEFHGGPQDGQTQKIPSPKKELNKYLREVNGCQNIMIVLLPIWRNKNYLHVYASNGPIDFPLLETYIDLYYHGVKDINSAISLD